MLMSKKIIDLETASQFLRGASGIKGLGAWGSEFEANVS